MKYNIIGDVAGRYDELMLLLQKMPEGEVILLGDLNDRGMQSKEVIDWAIANKIRCVKSNHGDMLISAYNKHHGTDIPSIRNEGLEPDKYPYVHFNNGGHETLISYGGIENVLLGHVKWLSELPWYIKENGLFLSHGPWHPKYDDLAKVMRLENRIVSLMWNRELPKYRDGLFQIHGHNTYHEVYHHYPDLIDDQLAVPFGMCIDNCGFDELMGVHIDTDKLPEYKLYLQEYI